MHRYRQSRYIEEIREEDDKETKEWRKWGKGSAVWELLLGCVDTHTYLPCRSEVRRTGTDTVDRSRTYMHLGMADRVGEREGDEGRR